MSIKAIKNETTYKLSLDALKNIIAKELEVDEKNVSVHYNIIDVADFDIRFPYYALSDVIVTVSEDIPQ